MKEFDSTSDTKGIFKIGQQQIEGTLHREGENYVVLLPEISLYQGLASHDPQ